MKKTLTAVFAILSLGAMALGPNLLENPGFETSPEGKLFPWSSAAGACAHDLRVARSGKASVRAEKSGGGDKKLFALLPHVELRGETGYTLSGWVKPGTAGAGLAGILMDAKGQYLGHNNIWTPRVAAGEDWTYVEQVFNSGKAAKLAVALVCSGEGEAWFDDLSLREGLAESSNHLRNSTFTQCATPGYPDWWGVPLTLPSSVEDWETGNYYGLDPMEPSPVPGAEVLRFKLPPVPVKFTPYAAPLAKLPKALYTFSAYAKSDSGKATLAVSGFTKPRPPRNVPDTWTRLSFTGEMRNGMAELVLDGSGTIWLAAPQLEVGGKPSDWRPSPNDLALSKALAMDVRPDAPGTEVALPRCAQPPVLDGKLDDPCWKTAWKAPGFVDNKTGKPAATPTEAWAACDADNLHFAFRCAEPDPARRQGTKGTGDSWGSFTKDAVELFLEAGSKDYAHVAVNPGGELFDAKGFAVEWSSGATVATGTEDGAWVVELSMPFSVLSTNGANSAKPWRLNLCRGRDNAGAKEFSAAAGQDSFHNPERFLRVKRMPVEIKPWAFVSPKLFQEPGRPGRLFVFVDSPGNSGKEFDAKLALADKAWEQSFTMPPAGKALNFGALPGTIALDSELTLTLHEAKRPKPVAEFKRKCLHLATPYDPESPARAFLEYSWYPVGAKTARVKVGSTLAGRCDLKLTLSQKGRTLHHRSLAGTGGDPAVEEIPLGGLPAGVYELWLECSQNGQPVAYAGDKLVLLQPKDGAVRMNRFTRSFEAGGKPFLPLLFHPYAGKMTPAWLFGKAKADGYNGMQSILPLEAGDSSLPQVAEFAGRCEASGLRHLMRPGHRGSATNIEEMLKRLGETIAAVQGFPSTLAYYTMDEPCKNNWEDKGFQESDLLKLGEAAKAFDPLHPAAVNYGPSSMGYGGFAASEFLLYDDYPNMSDSTEPLECFAANARTWNAAGKALGRCVVIQLPVWGCWDAIRSPTPDEWQNMAIVSLVHGSRGFINWMELPYSVPLIKRIREVNWIIQGISPMLLSKATKAIDGKVEGKVHYALWMEGDKACLAAANASSTQAAELEVDLAALATMELEKDGGTYAEGIWHSLQDGKFKASMPPRKSGLFMFKRKTPWWSFGLWM